MPLRLDIGEVTGKTEKTDEGYLKADAVVTRIGVFTYYNTDGSTRRELRLPEEVFKQDSLDTLKLKPVTNNHPKKMLNKDSVKRYQVGNTGENVRPVMDSLIMSTLMINDSVTIAEIEKKNKIGLSCGYTCELDEISGVYNGEKYDCIQRDIKYNHVAICENPRAGSVASLHLDSVDTEEDKSYQIRLDETNKPNPKQNPKGRRDSMAKITLRKVEYEADQEVINRIDELEKEKQAIQAKYDSEKESKETLQAEADSNKEKLDEIQANYDSLIETQDKKELTSVATKFLGKEFKTDSLSLLDVKKAIIVKAFPKAKEKMDDEKTSEAYIDARYDAAIELLEEHKDSKANLKKKVTPKAPYRRDTSDKLDAVDLARENMIRRAKGEKELDTE